MSNKRFWIRENSGCIFKTIEILFNAVPSISFTTNIAAIFSSSRKLISYILFYALEAFPPPKEVGHGMTACQSGFRQTDCVFMRSCRSFQHQVLCSSTMIFYTRCPTSDLRVNHHLAKPWKLAHKNLRSCGFLLFRVYRPISIRLALLVHERHLFYPHMCHTVCQTCPPQMRRRVILEHPRVHLLEPSIPRSTRPSEAYCMIHYIYTACLSHSPVLIIQLNPIDNSSRGTASARSANVFFKIPNLFPNEYL